MCVCDALYAGMAMQHDARHGDEIMLYYDDGME